ncbi:MAG TPA: lysine--tRNA ligase [Armatimonadetes bacterium]|nr:lysine--tRNA ligase [Armatimonadota bacterium]
MSVDDEQVAGRRARLAALREQGADPFCIHRFDRTHTSAEVATAIQKIEAEAPDEVNWDEAAFATSVCGRLMAVRDQGKSIWADIHDAGGKVQLWAGPAQMGEEAFEEFKNLHIGDIIGVHGEAFRTRRGEPTVRIKECVLLSKSLRPLPEKFHGLQDVQLRYRRRYLDLIVNPEVREIFARRTAAVKAIRSHLDALDYQEVTTPMMQPLYGGANARPFITHHNTLDMDLYLRIAPELYLKRLVVGGMERVYEIGRVFRNEGVDASHNPEFTLLEAYQAYTDYQGMMELFEGLVCATAMAVNGSLTFEYRGQQIDLTPPWRRVGLLEAVREASGVDFAESVTDDDARAACRDLDLGDMQKDGWAGLLDKTFDRYVQPELIQPTFVVDYPVVVSPLAKRLPDRPSLAARFEPFIGGAEIGNAFSELNDPDDQRARFESQVRAGLEGDAEAHPLDEDYLMAMEYGLPPTGGMGMGVDRLVMLLTGCTNLREVILFPQMRPEEG